MLDSDLRSGPSISERAVRLSRFYQVHQFAELAGVTVKALHHYDRLGLLKPRRTEAGYRLYAERDLERLEQIIALKFLGLPLKQIKVVLDQAALELADALRLQRRAIEEKKVLLDRGIRAIRAAEDALQPGQPADPAILKKIIEVIDMQDSVEVMKKYHGTPEAWERNRRLYEEGPSAEWQQIYRDAAALLSEDPGGEKALALLARWFELSMRAVHGDPQAQTFTGTAWMDREHWPPAMKQRIAEFHLEEVNEFIKRADVASRKKYFSEEAWAKLAKRMELRKLAPEDVSRSWQDLVDLFRDSEAAAGEDPAGEKAQALAARWLAHLESTSGGDPEIKAGLVRAWADRPNWPRWLRWQVEALCMMTDERFDQAADFLDRAVDEWKTICVPHAP